MDDVPLCPPWWPKIIWELHFFPRPPGSGPGPINLPVAIEDMMAALTVHTMSYLLLDQQAGQQIRAVAEAQLVKTTQNLSKLHDEAAARKQASPEQKS
jgi:hypothetical protein